MTKPLSADELDSLVEAGWTHDAARDTIRKTFKFKSFSAAFAFMTRTAMAAEKLNHHPEWSNVYGTVDVTLTTHSSNRLTELDMKLAKQMDHFAAG